MKNDSMIQKKVLVIGKGDKKMCTKQERKDFTDLIRQFIENNEKWVKNRYGHYYRKKTENSLLRIRIGRFLVKLQHADVRGLKATDEKKWTDIYSASPEKLFDNMDEEEQEYLRFSNQDFVDLSK